MTPHVRLGPELEGRFTGLMTLVVVGDVPRHVVERLVETCRPAHLFFDWPAGASVDWPWVAAVSAGRPTTGEVKHAVHLRDAPDAPWLHLLWRPDPATAAVLLRVQGVKIETRAYDVQWSLLSWRRVEPAEYDPDLILWSQS